MNETYIHGLLLETYLIYTQQIHETFIHVTMTCYLYTHDHEMKLLYT